MASIEFLKRILLISDTHGYLDPQLLKHAKEADEVWHAGDIGEPDVCTQISRMKPVKAVFGNIDGGGSRLTYTEDAVFDCEGVKILITHIAGPFGKYTARTKELIKEHKPDVLVCGHSHILKVAYDKGHELLYMNPGACGVHGFHQVRTALRFCVEESKVKKMEVIELGSRAKTKI